MASLRPADTSPQAWDFTQQAHARLGPEGRVRAAFEASEFIREVTREGIRAQHPDYDEAKVARALFGRIYGDALRRKVYPAPGDRP